MLYATWIEGNSKNLIEIPIQLKVHFQLNSRKIQLKKMGCKLIFSTCEYGVEKKNFKKDIDLKRHISMPLYFGLS
jgi:hypothetical protein